MHAIDMIEQAGYEAVEARNADDAIRILGTRKDICIMFTDIEMPGSMDGLKLARAVRNRWPPIELIVTSGRYKLSADDLPARGQFVSKPYDLKALVAVIERFAG
jgi:CheY-like chemotaxis protein